MLGRVEIVHENAKTPKTKERDKGTRLRTAREERG